MCIVYTINLLNLSHISMLMHFIAFAYYYYEYYLNKKRKRKTNTKRKANSPEYDNLITDKTMIVNKTNKLIDFINT